MKRIMRGRLRDHIAELAKKLKTPEQVQAFLRRHNYNREEEGETLKSANEALKLKSYHCLEACFIAAAVLEKHGYVPRVLSFESQDYLDHVVYVYQNKHGKWGSIGRSRDEGLHGRKPVFKTARELAKTYIDPYIDLTGRIKAFAVVNLDECRADWRYSRHNVWAVEQYLSDYKHQKLNCTDRHYRKVLKDYKAGFMKEKKSYWT